MRSTKISRCSSPMPDMMVWPDSSSVWTRNDGSSCASRLRAMPIFSWSALVFGSTACDITGVDFLDFLALVGVHLQDAAEPFALALGRVVHRVARIHHARIHAEKGQLADEGVGHDLERERGERLVVG